MTGLAESMGVSTSLWRCCACASYVLIYVFIIRWRRKGRKRIYWHPSTPRCDELRNWSNWSNPQWIAWKQQQPQQQQHQHGTLQLALLPTLKGTPTFTSLPLAGTHTNWLSISPKRLKQEYIRKAREAARNKNKATTTEATQESQQQQQNEDSDNTQLEALYAEEQKQVPHITTLRLTMTHFTHHVGRTRNKEEAKAKEKEDCVWWWDSEWGRLWIWWMGASNGTSWRREDCSQWATRILTFELSYQYTSPAFLFAAFFHSVG